jgi:hypothetical protein
MATAIPAGPNIILGIGIIGLGAGINGTSIGGVSTGLVNITGTGGTDGMMMTK